MIKKASKKQTIDVRLERKIAKKLGLNAGTDVSIYNESGYQIEAYGDVEAFNFNIEDLPFCCGVKEIGEFDYSGPLKNIGITDEDRAELLAQGIMECIKRHSYAAKGNRKIFLSTIVSRRPDSDLFEKALIKTGVFILASEFNNLGGSKGLKTYITK